MPKLKSLLLITMLAVAPLFSWAEPGGQGVGSGGDALRQLMEQARWAALGRLSAIDWCSFAPNVSPVLSQWILQHMNEFKQDVQNSNHLWVVDAQSTCGFTQHSSTADIYFSYPTCAATIGNNLNSALFTLLHETAHHLGVSDEKQADLVAQAILDANIALQCPAATQDVFNPLVCQGPVFTATDAAKYLQPGQSQTNAIGKYQAYARYRQCNYLTGCGAWVASKVVKYSTNGLGEVSLTIYAISSNPYFDITVAGEFDGSPHLLASGIPGALKLNVENGFWLESNTMMDFISSKISGELRQGCGWFQIQRRTENKSNGTYMESEIVVYGQN